MAAITKGEDGVYRWAYEFSLYRNPTIFLTIAKIFIAIIAALFAVSTIVELAGGSFTAESLLESLAFWLKLAALFLVLALVGYLVYAAMQGGKYCVLFEMDEEGIIHRQFGRQVEKAQVVSLINVLMGVAGGNATQVGIGLTSAKSQLASSFPNVRSVKGSRFWGVIKVNEPLAKNQVYVDRDDYDFVFSYIAEHCPNATVKG